MIGCIFEIQNELITHLKPKSLLVCTSYMHAPGPASMPSAITCMPIKT